MVAGLESSIRRKLWAPVVKRWVQNFKARFLGLWELVFNGKLVAMNALTHLGPGAISSMKAFKMVMPNMFIVDRDLIALSGGGC